MDSEVTVAMCPQKDKLLAAAIDGPVFTATELSDVPDSARTAPSQQDHGGLFSR